MYKHFFKPLFDFLLSLLAIIILSPFFLLFTPIVAIAMKGNPFFVQPRPGKNGKIFKMIKYRTMTNAKDENGELLPDEKRLTKFGKLMRKLSLDELPEIFNIFAGQMSIVGPRPLLARYLPYYTEEEMHRHDVRPGLTGLAQVSGRNAMTWADKVDKDLEYVKNVSLLMDIRIIIKTVLTVVKREGILQQGAVHMSRPLDIERKFYGMMHDEDIDIREFTLNDVEKKVEWINNDENNRYLHYDLPLEYEKTVNWFENKSKNRIDAVIEYQGKPVGLIGLLDLSGTPEFYIVIGESEVKRKGIAYKASIMFLDAVKISYNFDMIVLYTEEKNVAAQKLFEKIGFVKTELLNNDAINKGEKVNRYKYVYKIR